MITLDQQKQQWESLANGLLFQPKRFLPKSLQPGSKMAAAWVIVFENQGISPRALFEKLNDMGRTVTPGYCSRIIEELSGRKLLRREGRTHSVKLYVEVAK